MHTVSQLLKSLSDETRLRIINLIFERELCVCDIMESLVISQTKASRHLGILRNSGLVQDRKSAQWVYYSIPEERKLIFLKSLVFEGLRSEKTYIDDLSNLNLWLEKKSISCN